MKQGMNMYKFGFDSIPAPMSLHLNVYDGSAVTLLAFSQVGLLIFLSLLLRAAPAALLLRSQALLLGGKIFSGPGRLHLLLWLINQTVR